MTALRRSRQLPHNIIKSLRAGGLIAAVLRSVCHSAVLQCRTDFEAGGVERGTFEAIVNRYHAEFDAEAVEMGSLQFAQSVQQPLQAAS